MTDPSPTADSDSYVPPAYVPLKDSQSEPSALLLPSSRPMGPQADHAAVASTGSAEAQPLTASAVAPVPAAGHVAVDLGSSINPRDNTATVALVSGSGSTRDAAAASSSNAWAAAEATGTGSPPDDPAGEGEEGGAPAHVISHTHFSHRSPWLRAFLLGANDGLVSTASLMIGVGAVQQEQSSMIVSGLAGLVAGERARRP